MTYYIETLPHNWKFNEKPGIIDLTGKSAKEIYSFYNDLCNSKKYGHLTLRHFNGWLHGLISEWFINDTSPFWYTTYTEYKNFMEDMNK